VRVLFLTPVWPEPQSSAAGARVRDWIEAGRARGWAVACVSPARENEHAEALRARGVECARHAPNDSAFDAWVAAWRPDVVVFERFNLEEQFSFRVRAACPDALRVLETIDLHCLRRARGEALAEGEPLSELLDPELPFGAPRQGWAARLHGDDAFREVAAILRSDLSLIISDYELRVLTGPLGVPASEKLEWLPLGWTVPEEADAAEPGRHHSARQGFAQRGGFTMIGSFRHPPNADAVRWLRAELWPRVRARLPRAEVRIYGSYPTREFMDLHDPAQGFRVLGPARDAIEVFRPARVNLAPLRFGAGVKGKILDGWAGGAPCVTTPIGAEGMGFPAAEWGGRVAADPDALAAAAIELHEDESAWARAAAAGARLLRDQFDGRRIRARFVEVIERAWATRADRRARDFLGSLLWHQSLRGTEYFSRWIELKRRGDAGAD
jgi:hypothetical protein